MQFNLNTEYSERKLQVVWFLFSLASVVSLTKQLVLAAVKLLMQGQGVSKQCCVQRAQMLLSVFLAQVPSSQGHRLMPSLEQANKTGGKACVHNFPDSCGQAETNVLGINCLPGTGKQSTWMNHGMGPCHQWEVEIGAAWGGPRQ